MSSKPYSKDAIMLIYIHHLRQCKSVKELLKLIVVKGLGVKKPSFRDYQEIKTIYGDKNDIAS